MAVVTLVDYGMGNLRSLANAFRALDVDVRWATRPEDLQCAGHVVLPGVGALGKAVANLSASGMDAAVLEHVKHGAPLMGICVGFQLLFTRGFEFGEHNALGLFQGEVRRFETTLHVPHVGWNVLHVRRPHPWFDGLPDAPHVYFVHSYRPEGTDPQDVLADSEYDGAFVAAVARGNVGGAQFHPEKSGPDGLRMLRNFVDWAP